MPMGSLVAWNDEIKNLGWEELDDDRQETTTTFQLGACSVKPKPTHRPHAPPKMMMMASTSTTITMPIIDGDDFPKRSL